MSVSVCPHADALRLRSAKIQKQCWPLMKADENLKSCRLKSAFFGG
jgi:hypothetical protein